MTRMLHRCRWVNIEWSLLLLLATYIVDKVGLYELHYLKQAKNSNVVILTVISRLVEWDWGKDVTSDLKGDNKGDGDQVVVKDDKRVTELCWFILYESLE